MAKVLVIDDEAPLRTLLRGLLEKDGHEVLEAQNGNIAREIYDQQSDIDLIITDMVMPEQNGIDFIMEMKNINPDISLIAMSGGGGITGRFDYLPIAKLIGASVIVTKPFSIGVLREAVEEALSS